LALAFHMPSYGVVNDKTMMVTTPQTDFDGTCSTGASGHRAGHGGAAGYLQWRQPVRRQRDHQHPRPLLGAWWLLRV
jgi:hypothetical protein